MTTATADLIPTSRAAQLLGVTPERVRQLVRAGAIEPAQVLRSASGHTSQMLFDADAIERLVKARAQSAEPPTPRGDSA